MADPKAGDTGPVKGEDEGGRLPEDQLADLEAKAEGKSAEGGEAGQADGGDDDRPKPDADEISVERVSAFMRKKGINDITKVIDIAENLEKRNTQLDQDVRRLSAVGRFPAAGPGPVQPQGQYGRQAAGAGDDFDIEVPDNPLVLATDPKALKEWGKKLVMTGLELGQRRQARASEEQSFESVKAQVQAKMEANPEEFTVLRPVMLDISRANPGLTVDQLYDEAKRIRTADIKYQAEALRKELGLDGPDTKDRLKGILGRIRQAPISAGTGTQVNPGSKDEKKEHADLLKAIIDSDKY